jgi:hypothetical protein
VKACFPILKDGRRPMGKYDRLTRWLERQTADRIEVSFEDMEDEDKIGVHLRGHLKTGQRGSLQNRPTELARNVFFS